jgi:hypothetical protein
MRHNRPKGLGEHPTIEHVQSILAAPLPHTVPPDTAEK